MRGVKLTMSDPGQPGPHNEKTEYIVSDSSFNRKIVTVVDQTGTTDEHQLHEGTLDITETWNSAWRRQGTEVLNLGFKLLLAPLLVGLGVGGTLLWVDRPTTPAVDARQSQPAESAQVVQTEAETSVEPAASDPEDPQDAAKVARTPTPSTGDQVAAQAGEHDRRVDKPGGEAGPIPKPLTSEPRIEALIGRYPNEQSAGYEHGT